MSAAQKALASYLLAQKNIQTIKSVVTAAGIDQALFSQNVISDSAKDNARAKAGLEFQAFIQNLRAVNPNSEIGQRFPGVYLNLKEGVSRRNWLAHEYVTAAPIDWGEVAKSVYEDLPKIEMELEAAIAELDK